ncbi:MAG: RNA-protein complex protein Nop10 [Thermoplasmata archaeon]
MTSYIRKCKTCGEYTLKEYCPRCKNKTVTPHPFRFSPEDRYGTYRRALKKMSGDE